MVKPYILQKIAICGSLFCTSDFLSANTFRLSVMIQLSSLIY